MGSPRATIANPRRYGVQDEHVIIAALTGVARISPRMKNELNRYSAVARSSSGNTSATITQTIEETTRLPPPSKRNKPGSQTSRRDDDQPNH